MPSNKAKLNSNGNQETVNIDQGVIIAAKPCMCIICDRLSPGPETRISPRSVKVWPADQLLKRISALWDNSPCLHIVDFYPWLNHGIRWTSTGIKTFGELNTLMLIRWSTCWWYRLCYGLLIDVCIVFHSVFSSFAIHMQFVAELEYLLDI